MRGRNEQSNSPENITVIGWCLHAACLQLDQGHHLRQGIQVVVVQISTDLAVGRRSNVRRVLKRVSGSVVLVGHSDGGAVITAAGSRNLNVKALAYAAAMAPGRVGLENGKLFL